MPADPDCVLIFGGTFDPPHLAHTLLPPLVAREIGCDRIIYVPTSANPLKHERPTPAHHRLEMLRRAIHGIHHASIETRELRDSTPAYTVDTLEYLNNRLERESPSGQRPRLHLLIGADNAVKFHRWKDPDRILELATPVVLLRPPLDRDGFRRELAQHQSPQRVAWWMERVVDLPLIEISGTDIRARLRSGRDPAPLMTPAVVSYIREHGLYGVEPRGERDREAAGGNRS